MNEGKQGTNKVNNLNNMLTAGSIFLRQQRGMNDYYEMIQFHKYVNR